MPGRQNMYFFLKIVAEVFVQENDAIVSFRKIKILGLL